MIYQHSTPRAYRWLAQYYDEFFSSLRTPIDLARERVLGRILPRVRTACDLACGTGSTALLLARTGINVYAVDISLAMCHITRQKAHDAHLPIHVLRGDMRSFCLPEQVDLITCECDAINHVPQKSDLLSVAKCASRALTPGGHFYFDVNNSVGFKDYWSGNVWFEKNGVALVMRNGHNRQGEHAWSDIECFIKEGKCWHRHHERVEEVCWTSEEIRRIFQGAGFDDMRAWDAAPFFKSNFPVRPGCRTIYLARKPQSVGISLKAQSRPRHKVKSERRTWQNGR